MLFLRIKRNNNMLYVINAAACAEYQHEQPFAQICADA